jgi:SAM-dependent methyltransferase
MRPPSAPIVRGMGLARDVFWKLHSGLAKQGPGSDASTARALELVGALPREPRILDLGCGTGRQSLALARLTGGRVTAVDLAGPSLAILRERSAAAGLAQRIETVQQSMSELELGARRFDLVWCESAVYTIGFDVALRAWRPLLAPGGALALSELAWLAPRPPERALRFWAAAYPGMRAHEANLRALAAAGYALAGSFTLPDADWQDGYYAELARRIPALRAQHAEPEARAVLDGTEEEIAVFREREGSFGYVFYVCSARS